MRSNGIRRRCRQRGPADCRESGWASAGKVLAPAISRSVPAPDFDFGPNGPARTGHRPGSPIIDVDLPPTKAMQQRLEGARATGPASGRNRSVPRWGIQPRHQLRRQRPSRHGLLNRYGWRDATGRWAAPAASFRPVPTARKFALLARAPSGPGPASAPQTIGHKASRLSRKRRAGIGVENGPISRCEQPFNALADQRSHECGRSGIAAASHRHLQQDCCPQQRRLGQDRKGFFWLVGNRWRLKAVAGRVQKRSRGHAPPAATSSSGRLGRPSSAPARRSSWARHQPVQRLALQTGLWSGRPVGRARIARHVVISRTVGVEPRPRSKFVDEPQNRS